MVTSQKHMIICLLFLLAFANINAQGHLFSEVKINRTKIYVGEPVEVSVGIYTSTWFTKGVNFGNIKVNGAFTVYFRSVASSKQINGKNYAGVVAIYNVFPYDNKDILFPSLELTVETPNDGDYKGVKRIVTTKSRNIDVKPVPNNYDRDEWLVSSSVTVNESWQGDMKNTKVGDVIQRRIIRKAYGTVSELIPPIKWDSIKGVSLYPTRADIKSEKSKTSISASRSEGVRYLFEKEGTVTLPKITVTWWNPRQNKLFKRTLKSQTIEVLPNPDLGMLETIRDSLQIAKQDLKEEGIEEAETKILGLSIRDFLRYLLITFVLLYAFYRFLKWLLITKGLLEHWKKQKKDYLQSEKYFFKLFLVQANKKDAKAGLNSLYNWIDRLNLEEPTIEYFAKKYGSNDLISQLDKAKDISDFDPTQKIHHIKKARKNYLEKMKQGSEKVSNGWINP